MSRKGQIWKVLGMSTFDGKMLNEEIVKADMPAFCPIHLM
jgi:hypothetical protein